MPVISDIVTTTRASQATYFDANGVMQTAANDVMRLDHDPVTGAPRGVLIEEARTNFMLRSGDPGGTGYTVTGMTVTPNAGVAPNGENVATLLVENTSTGLHRTAQAPSDVPVAGTAFWNSVFVKKLPGSPRSLVVVENLQYANHTKRTTACFDLDTGQFVSVVGTQPEARVEVLKDGWFRLYNFGEAAGTGSVGLNVGLALNQTTFNYEGDGVSGIYVWGFSRENGAFPTSYIPTTTAAATRAADRPTVEVGPWFDMTKGTFVAEASTFATLDSVAANRRHVWAVLETGTNGLEVFYNSTGVTALVGGNNTPVSFGGPVLANSIVKSGLAYSDGSVAGSVDGSAVQTYARALPTTPTLLVIGDRGASGGRRLNGHIRSITYYPRRLSNSELQAATVLS